MIKELEIEFVGRGEVKGHLFRQINKTDNAYIYEVKNIETEAIHYEVFKRMINTIFNCVSYPKSNSFGLWAWCFIDKEKAEDKFKELK